MVWYVLNEQFSNLTDQDLFVWFAKRNDFRTVSVSHLFSNIWYIIINLVLNDTKLVFTTNS